jgi:ribosomal protein S18 acetylase RimI-like enzyme
MLEPMSVKWYDFVMKIDSHTKIFSNEFRRMGIAKDLSQSCVKKFYGKTIFLGTEKDSVDESIYERMGFKTVAVGKCYKDKG